MSWEYVPQEYGAFSDQMASLPSAVQELIIEAVLTRLKDNPASEKSPVFSKMLSDELYCIRRIHVTKLYVIAYTICEDCRNIHCDKKLGCLYCYQEPSYRVKLIACGLRGGFYDELERNWYSWLNTVTRAKAL